MIFENRLINNNIEGAQYNNIEFTADGALFGETLTPSFITLPFTKLNLSNPFNISFSYETFLEDGSNLKPFLLLLVDTHLQASLSHFTFILLVRE